MSSNRSMNALLTKGFVVLGAMLIVPTAYGDSITSSPIIYGNVLSAEGMLDGGLIVHKNTVFSAGDEQTPTRLSVQDDVKLQANSTMDLLLNTPNKFGAAGGSDLVKVQPGAQNNGKLYLHTDETFDITPGANFGPGTYELFRYGSLHDASQDFSGWSASVVGNSTPYSVSFEINPENDSVDAVVSIASPQDVVVRSAPLPSDFAMGMAGLVGVGYLRWRHVRRTS
jgi:hypothetical protein